MTQETLVVSETELLVQQLGSDALTEQVILHEVLEVANQGPPGPAGSGDLFLAVNQSTASATWTLTHNLGKYPSVSVVDSAGDQVEGNVSYLSLNSVQISFSVAFSGRAFFN